MQSVKIGKDARINIDDLSSHLSRWDTDDLKKAFEQIGKVLSLRNHKQPNEREMQLIQQIREIIPASVVRRYRQLQKKQRSGILTDKEQDEILLLTDFMEEKSAERVSLLGELAEIRGISISELARQFRIANSYA